jgi:hypothetical protein
VKSGLNNLQSKKDAACAFAPKLFYASGTFVFLDAPPLTVARHVEHDVGVSTRWLPRRRPQVYEVLERPSAETVVLCDPAIRSTKLGFSQPVHVSTHDLCEFEQTIDGTPLRLQVITSCSARYGTIIAQLVAACVLLASISRSTASVALVIAAQPLVETEAYVRRTTITLIVVVVTALLFGGHLNCLLVRRRYVDVEVQTEPWVQTQWFRFTVPELRAACQERRLRHSGLKGELVHALVEHEMRLS